MKYVNQRARNVLIKISRNLVGRRETPKTPIAHLIEKTGKFPSYSKPSTSS
jgi:hypothetical protein